MSKNLPSNWQQKKLEDCMEAIIDYRGKTPEKTSFGLPLITAKIVKDGRINNIQEYIAIKDYDSWMCRGLPQPGDIVMTTEAPLGEIAQLDNRKVALAQRLITLRGNPKILNNNYLKFLMQSSIVQNQLQERATGTTVLGIKQSELRKINLVLPPLPEQKAIAHILGTLDDKIELNKQMNETLEAMARAIFKSWFVDFDPVHAKMEGRQPAGMDAATADLFPDEFEESSLGLIPKGWRVGTLGEEIEIIKGKSYKSSELVPSSTALVTLKSFHRGGGYRSDGLKPYNGTYKPEQIIKPDELVVAYTDVTQAADVIGKPAIVKADERYNTLVASLDVGIIRVKNKNLNIPFLYYLFNQNDFQNHVYSHSNGSTVLHLSKDGIPSYKFCLPDVLLVSKFEKIIIPMFEKTNLNWQESIDITTIRDTLLPKLISGKIRVKEAEKILEGVS